MIKMGHSPSVVAMSAHRLLLLSNIIFEWVGGPGSLSCNFLIVGCFVTLHFSVERARRKWSHLLFLRTLEVFSIGTTFRFAYDCIVVGLKDFVKQKPWCIIGLQFPPTVSELR